MNKKAMKEYRIWRAMKARNAGDVYSRIHRGWSKEDAILKDQQSILRRN